MLVPYPGYSSLLAYRPGRDYILPMFDVLILNGKILDGTGKDAVPADIAVTGSVISGIGSFSGAESKHTLDAGNMYVCPGFIDVHSHSDTYLLLEPSANSKIFQGITTEVTGNCGASAAPLLGKYRLPSDWLDKEYPGKWSSFAEYRALLEQVKPAVNVCMLAGHNTLRAGIAGYENRALSKNETKNICRLLEQCMDEGARGLSTGFLYPPGMFAPREEINTLAGIVARHNGIYTSHMRSEGAALLDAIRETIDTGRKSGARIEISHLKTSGRKNWHLVDEAISLISNAIDEGIRVCADRYPYTSGCTDLDVVFPAWAEEGGRDAILRRLADGPARERIRQDLMKMRTEEDWTAVTIGSTGHPDNKRFQGMPLPRVAEELKMHPVDAVLHILATDKLKTSAFFSGMSEDNMLKILALPFVMLGTDASLRAPSGVLSADYPHPRAYGSFPRFLRMVLDSRFISLPEAVHKITGLPAGHFNLPDRGILAKGLTADITVFDPETIADKSTYPDPHRLSSGIEHVIVNGAVAVEKGHLTGTRPGRVL